MNSRYFTSEIKDRLKMPDVLEHYGISVNRQRRIPCPIHGGTDANCGVKDRYIHCFVCGESADVIGFVQRHFDVDFNTAIKKINEDFCLGLPIGQRLDRRQKEQIAKRRFLAEKEKKAKMAEYQQIKDEYNAALDEWVRLDRQKREYRPENENCTLHPLFVDAIMNLSHAERRLDTAEMELYLYETRNRGNS
jgi:DNA primase